jgi:hypothetical protein
MPAKKLNRKLQAWSDAQERHHLSHAHVQMARELGMNPEKLSKIDNHRQEPWKAPLPQFIEACYSKRFGKAVPDTVMSIEQRFRLQQAKKEARRAAKQNTKSGQARARRDRGDGDEQAR